MQIAARISTLPEFSHVESPLILRICEVYEKELRNELERRTDEKWQAVVESVEQENKI